MVASKLSQDAPGIVIKDDRFSIIDRPQLSILF